MQTPENVLTRKLARGGVARSPLPETELIGESFARMVEDRLRPIVKSMIAAIVADCQVVKLGRALQDISVPTMLGVVEVEDADTPGLLNIDTDLAYHLIDLTLGGDPSAAPVPTTRSFTAIDTAVLRHHLEALIAAFVAAVALGVGRPLKRAVRLREQRQSIAQMRLAPDYVDVLVMRLELDIGEAARTGKFDLILPLSALDVIRAATEDEQGEAARERPNDLWKLQMRRVAAAAPIALDAVLHRQRLTLAQINALRPGQLLEIPESAPGEVQLTIAQPDGKTAAIAFGQLGIYQGSKVIKLDTPPDRRLLEHVRRALGGVPLPAPSARPQLPPPVPPPDRTAADQAD